MDFYRRDGSTFDDVHECARLLCDIDYRNVRQDRGERWSVSTVFLVIPHPPWWEDGYPSLYESLISIAGEEDRIERYPNEIAALAGHDQAVADCRLKTADHARSSEEFP